MKTFRLNIFLKYFLIITGVLLVVTAVWVQMSVSHLQQEREKEAYQQLKLAARLCALSLPGEDVQRVLTYRSTSLPAFERLAVHLRQQFQVFSQNGQEFRISRISLILPENNTAKLIFSTQIPFRFLEEVPWYPEIDSVFRMNRTIINTHLVEGEHRYWSAFAPVLNAEHKTIAVLRLDMPEQQIFAGVPGFWGSFLKNMFFMLLLSLVLSFLLSRMVTRPVHQFVSFVNKVSEGNYHLRYKYRTNDELDKIGEALNVMLERLEGLIESEADRDRLQQQITSLLRIVSAAADGDFRVKAEVTADTLGALADSFNLMISELSSLIRDVQKASEQISRSTNEILKSSEVMARGADKQAKEIDSVYNAIKNMADIVQYANDRSTQAAQAASRAAEVAKKGTEIVRRTIEGMHRIRDTVQETARRVQILGQNSQEIGEILELISDIANRTNLLGLNATIEAARASEAGRGFAVVADEVRNLAERSSQAAKDIAVLVESIQAGTTEAVMAMEHGTVEVEKETRLVDEAGAALKEILEMVQQSDTLINEISASFQHQSKAAAEITKAMEQIKSIAQDTAQGAQRSKQLSEEMANLSRILSVAVSKFRLPSEDQNLM